jgi:hypothetical protein
MSVDLPTGVAPSTPQPPRGVQQFTKFPLFRAFPPGIAVAHGSAAANNQGEKIVKKLIAVSLTVLAMLGVATVSAEERVLGESLDSGLGALASTYSADEYRKK